MATQLNQNTAELQAILDAVNALPEAGSGDPVLQEKIVTPTTSQQEVTPDADYDGLSKVTVEAVKKSDMIPADIFIDSETGIVTAEVTYLKGYVDGGVAESTLELPTLSDYTITPSTDGHIVGAGVFLTGPIVVEGDENLVQENIRSGVTLFGIPGIYDGSGGGDDGSFKAIIERTAVNPTLPSDLTKIGYGAFNGCNFLAVESLPEGIVSIGISAFSSCSALALTSLPAGLTSIGAQAFNFCEKLALTSLPDRLATIDSGAFYYCKSLALTKFPKSIETIGSGAFRYCTGLRSLTFEGTPSSINSSAFSDCTNLTTINVPWAEGEVANAPWGATNATINYNYTGA